MTLLERVTGKELKNPFLSIARKFTAFQDHRAHCETKTSSLIFGMLSVLEGTINVDCYEIMKIKFFLKSTNQGSSINPEFWGSETRRNTRGSCQMKVKNPSVNFKEKQRKED